MAERNLVHQSSDQQRGLEASIRTYDPPFLPYEIALIEALGCTEQEYREFVRHAELRARVRPAGYAHVPDIENDVVSIVVSLVIGLALSAASTLLAPKAPALESPEKIKGKKLADQIGPSRFNQTTSFDNVASLAELGQAIPVPFGRRGTGSDGELTGGLIVAPSLVWSRCFSYGTYQTFEGVYAVGQAGLDTPEISGIRVGTVALDSIDVRDYALYWSSVTGDNFPSTKIAGTEPTNRLVFTAPSESGENRYGFSMAYNPTSKTTFGTSTPIHNGTGYRFNWEIISAPESTWEDSEAVADAKAKRRKIAGKGADVINNPALPERRGQPGVGREYSRKMGITTYNNSASQYRQVIDSVSVGDTCVFEVNGGNWNNFAEQDFNIDNKYKTEVNLEDLNSSADAWRTRAVDLLSRGSKWIIGNCVWVVESRNAEFWKRNSNVQVTLRCIEVLGVSSLGLTGYATVRGELAGYDGDFFDSRLRIGTGWWNICAFNDALVRPVRRDARAIEIGIRSQVWNKANGLCNFNAVPTPARLVNLDKRNVQVNTPRMDKYFARTSFFSVLVRPVAVYGEAPNPWRRIPEVFCVTGQTPVDQYNYLRIQPQSSEYFEYRLVPRTGSDIWLNSSDTETFVRLNAQAGNVVRNSYTNAYGTFEITTTGEDGARKVDVASCREMYSKPGQRSTITTTTGPNTVSADKSWGTGGTKETANALQAWLTEILGYAPSKTNERASGTVTFTQGGKSVTILVEGTSSRSATNPYYWEKITRGSRYNWDKLEYTVTDFTGTWAKADKFVISKTVTESNVIGKHWKYKTVSTEFTVASISTVYGDTDRIDADAREFEDNTQIVDVSHYQELTKSNESGPEHEIVYINEFIENNSIPQYDSMSMLGLSIKSSSKVSTVGQLRAWMPNGIQVFKALTEDIGYTNRFAEIVYYLLTDVTQGIGNTLPEELVDLESLQTTALFQRENRIFFDGVLEDVQNIRSFIYDNAALHLCNFTIKNGRFGLMPAVPYEASGKISSNPINVSQIFTAGNIIADSLQVNYIDAAQRTNFRAIVIWRVTTENDLPTQASAFLNWADLPIGDRATSQQTFDLTDFCTNREQALLTARFLMSVRRRVTHTISFKTTPAGLAIEPGSYIRVITESTTYSASNNGVITDAGTLVSVTGISNGKHTALVYYPQTSEVLERQITVSGNSVSDSSLYGTIFTLLNTAVSKGVYQIDQITIDEDGLANISAVHVPVDASGASIVVQDILTPARFTVAE
jgi:hypothetical protein